MADVAEQRSWVGRVLGITLPDRDAPRGDTEIRRQSALDGGDSGILDFFSDVKAKIESTVTGTDPRAEEKKVLLASLARLHDPSDADTKEKDAFKQERDAIGQALKDDPPSTENVNIAKAALDRLEHLIEAANRRIAVANLAKRDPEAGKDAEEALGKFQKLLGDTEVTPAKVKEASQAREAKEKELAQALNVLKKAQKLPDTEKLKQPAIKKAQQIYDGLKQEADRLADRENAMVGLTSLTAALQHGPMSGETGAPFKPETVRKLVAAYKDDPRMADSAVRAAGTAKYPDLIADNVGPMIARSRSGFAAGNGEAFDNRDFSQQYGQDLLKMGGEVGPEYFARLPDYIASGQQFATGATGDGTATTRNQVAQNRSVKLAGALIAPDGGVDVTSDGAKAAIGNALFHPDAMRTQTPAFSEHVLKTVDFLADPTTGPQAGAVLKGVTAPTSPAAQKLIRTSLGKGGSDAVDDTGARSAVLAAMLKSVDQGPVGSCFATAPSRRMRETQPLDAMKAYAQIASKGTYKPPFGPEVPAVTNIAAGDDPLIGSFEYSTATATARRAGSDQRKDFAQHFAAGVDDLKGSAVKHETGDKDKAWQKKKLKLTNDVANAFTFTYDPLAISTDSSDGHSSQGRYLIERVSDHKQIKTKDEFEAAVTEEALQSLGIDPKAPEAEEVRKTVSSTQFINKVCPAGYKPWELAGGGQTQEATQTLFGDKLTQQTMLAAGNTTQNEGTRTAQVMTGFLNNFQNDPRQMATIRTVGMHGFNALPNNPSLAPLKGKDPAETAQKVKENLTDKAATLANTDLPAERAAWMFDEAIQQEADSERDPDAREAMQKEAQAFRPTGPMKPPALKAAIEHALDAYHERWADAYSQNWGAGGGHSGTDIQKKKADVKKYLDDRAAGRATTAMVKDTGAPEFVIADSNWGDATNHVFFVMVPDPTTGEPRLFEKTEPPGELRPAGRKWVDAEWADIR